MIEVIEKYVVRYTNEGVNSTWDHSEFPHPLVTVDYNVQDEVYGVTIVLPADIAKKVGT